MKNVTIMLQMSGYVFRLRLSVRFGCLWLLLKVGLAGVGAVVAVVVTESRKALGWPIIALFEPRRGFSGESVLLGGRASAGGWSTPPVTRLRIPGRDVLPFIVLTEELIESRFSRSVPMNGPEPGKAKTDGSSSFVPAAWRRAFSCLFCTFRKWERSSDHLISSRPSLERVVDTLGTFLHRMEGCISSVATKEMAIYVRLWCDMEKA